MPIPVQCTCGLVMEAPDEMVGQACECPQCKIQFIVPAPAPAATPAAAPAAPQQRQQQKQKQQQPQQRKAAAKQRKQSQAPAADPGGLGSLLDEIGVQKARSRHTCPECRADITGDAIICVSCGMNLETGKRVKQKLYPSEPKAKKAKPHPGQRTEARTSSGDQEGLGIGMMVACFLVPFLGFILYFAYKKSAPRKSNQAGNIVLLIFAINIMIAVASMLAG